MRTMILFLTGALFSNGSATAQEFKAILSSNDFRPGNEITLTILGGVPPFTFFFGSGLQRDDQLLLKITRHDERTYRLTVTESLDPALAKWRTITVEDKTGREVLAQVMPKQVPPQLKDNGLIKLTADLQSANELVRLQAAKKLGMMGIAARPALPTLRQLLHDPDEDVRLVAAAAIRRLEGTWGTEWVKMTLPDQRFEIHFPAMPRETPEEPGIQDVWKVEVRADGWELVRQDLDQGLAFMVLNVLPPNRVNAQPARFWFDGFQQRILSKEATTLVASRDFKIADKYAARDVEFKVGNDQWRGRARMVLSSSSVYVIFTFGSVEFLDSTLVKRFTESFRTSDEPAREPATGAERVQTLIQRLQSPEPFDRLFALRSLAKLGAKAKDAIPFVEKLANDGNAEERSYAQVVLRALRSAPVGPANGQVATPPFRIEGELTADDNKDTVNTDSYRKVVHCRMASGTSYVFDLVSKDFDAYLRIEDEQGKELAWNDDGGGDCNARIAFRAPADSVYRIIATTFHDKAVGKLVLNVRPEGETRDVLRIDGQITADDERDTDRTESIRKVCEVKMSAGREYVIDLRSEDFDSYLRLEGDDGAELAKDDDSGGFPHARIRYRAARDGVYRIIATTYRGGAYGRFFLSVTEEVLPR